VSGQRAPSGVIASGAQLPAQRSLQAAVLAWGRQARRPLPWRATRDPWAVLVSEIMLAQTQAARVIPKWEAFMVRWPNPGACAAAPAREVIAAWAGLGYNRRALLLHRAAAIISERYGGSVPRELHALMALPGVGPYTARAVLAFAFERPVGVLDTNAARVLARAVAGRPLDGQHAQGLVDSLVPRRRSWEWNQAVLDLGALVCTSRRPACRCCPLGPTAHRAALCSWARTGGPDPAAGSAGTSRPQSRFDGSDRQGRGRLVAALVTAQARNGPGGVPPASIATEAGWPDDVPRAAAMARGLVADGLAVFDEDGTLRLP
jgi:A/G-specific adenine glycosylase